MKNNRFVAVDFEMANNDLPSICQLGFAVFENFELVSQWETLVNPNAEFGYHQTRVHNITAEDVQSAPVMQDLKDQVFELVRGQVVCSFGMNDLHALAGNFAMPECKWMDGSKVVKAVWPNLSKGQRGLRGACIANNVPLSNHHNALADALALGNLMNEAMRSNELILQQLLKFSCKDIIAGHRYNTPAARSEQLF